MTPSTGNAPVSSERLQRGGAQRRRRQQRLDDADGQRRAQAIEPLERGLRQEQFAARERARRAPCARRCHRRARAPRRRPPARWRPRRRRSGASTAPARRSPMSPSASAMSLRCSGLAASAPMSAGTACGPSATQRLDHGVAPPHVLRLGQRRRQHLGGERGIAERRRARRRFLAHAPARVAHRLHEEVERLRLLVGVGRRGHARDRAATDFLLVAAEPEPRLVERDAHEPAAFSARRCLRISSSASAMKSRVRRTSAGTRRSNNRRPSSRSMRKRASSS